MISRKKETRFRQKLRQPDETVQPQASLSFLNKLTQRFPAKVGGAAISALIVLHFVSQFIFFQNDNAPVEITAPKIENEQIVEIKPEKEPVKSDITALPAEAVPAAPAVVEPVPAAAPPLQKSVKKKQSRESKTERLRRAERILTGV